MGKGKLIRDKVPEIIRANGDEPITRAADAAEYRELLRAKLVEEVDEVLAAEDKDAPEELADVLEVVLAYAADLGLDAGQLEEIRKAKAEEGGRFANRDHLVRRPAQVSAGGFVSLGEGCISDARRTAPLLARLRQARSGEVRIPHKPPPPPPLPLLLLLLWLFSRFAATGSSLAAYGDDLRNRVSGLYVASNDAGRAVDSLAGQPLLTARPGQPAVDIVHVNWHAVQVFRGGHVGSAV